MNTKGGIDERPVATRWNSVAADMRKQSDDSKDLRGRAVSAQFGRTAKESLSSQQMQARLGPLQELKLTDPVPTDEDSEDFGGPPPLVQDLARALPALCPLSRPVSCHMFGVTAFRISLLSSGKAKT
jgi:hypothetical protein